MQTNHICFIKKNNTLILRNTHSSHASTVAPVVEVKKHSVRIEVQAVSVVRAGAASAAVERTRPIEAARPSVTEPAIPVEAGSRQEQRRAIVVAGYQVAVHAVPHGPLPNTYIFKLI